MPIAIRTYIIITVLVVFWCAGIIIAPVLKHTGMHDSADIVYSFFSRVCYQNDAHSFHVGGEKLGSMHSMQCNLFWVSYRIIFNAIVRGT